jgi:hypothetical protein
MLTDARQHLHRGCKQNDDRIRALGSGHVNVQAMLSVRLPVLRSLEPCPEQVAGSADNLEERRFGKRRPVEDSPRQAQSRRTIIRLGQDRSAASRGASGILQI